MLVKYFKTLLILYFHFDFLFNSSASQLRLTQINCVTFLLSQWPSFSSCRFFRFTRPHCLFACSSGISWIFHSNWKNPKKKLDTWKSEFRSDFTSHKFWTFFRAALIFNSGHSFRASERKVNWNSTREMWRHPARNWSTSHHAALHRTRLKRAMKSGKREGWWLISSAISYFMIDFLQQNLTSSLLMAASDKSHIIGWNLIFGNRGIAHILFILFALLAAETSEVELSREMRCMDTSSRGKYYTKQKWEVSAEQQTRYVKSRNYVCQSTYKDDELACSHVVYHFPSSHRFRAALHNLLYSLLVSFHPSTISVRQSCVWAKCHICCRHQFSFVVGRTEWEIDSRQRFHFSCSTGVDHSHSNRSKSPRSLSNFSW